MASGRTKRDDDHELASDRSTVPPGPVGSTFGLLHELPAKRSQRVAEETRPCGDHGGGGRPSLVAFDRSGLQLSLQQRSARAFWFGASEPSRDHSHHLARTGNPRAELGLGEVAYKRGDLDAAVNHFTRASSSNIARKRSHILLAQVYRRLADEPAAIREQHQPRTRSPTPPLEERAGERRPP